MKRLGIGLACAAVLAVTQVRDAETGEYGLALLNGDTNGDLARDAHDGIYLVKHVFRDGPAPVPLSSCGDAPALLANGDLNADSYVDSSDAAQLFRWLYSDGPAPADACGASTTVDEVATLEEQIQTGELLGFAAVPAGRFPIETIEAPSGLIFVVTGVPTTPVGEVGTTSQGVEVEFQNYGGLIGYASQGTGQFVSDAPANTMEGYYTIFVSTTGTPVEQGLNIWDRPDCIGTVELPVSPGSPQTGLFDVFQKLERTLPDPG